MRLLHCALLWFAWCLAARGNVTGIAGDSLDGGRETGLIRDVPTAGVAVWEE